MFEPLIKRESKVAKKKERIKQLGPNDYIDFALNMLIFYKETTTSLPAEETHTSTAAAQVEQLRGGEDLYIIVGGLLRIFSPREPSGGQNAEWEKIKKLITTELCTCFPHSFLRLVAIREACSYDPALAVLHTLDLKCATHEIVTSKDILADQEQLKFLRAELIQILQKSLPFNDNLAVTRGLLYQVTRWHSTAYSEVIRELQTDLSTVAKDILYFEKMRKIERLEKHGRLKTTRQSVCSAFSSSQSIIAPSSSSSPALNLNSNIEGPQAAIPEEIKKIKTTWSNDPARLALDILNHVYPRPESSITDLENLQRADLLRGELTRIWKAVMPFTTKISTVLELLRQSKYAPETNNGSYGAAIIKIHETLQSRLAEIDRFRLEKSNKSKEEKRKIAQSSVATGVVGSSSSAMSGIMTSSSSSSISTSTLVPESGDDSPAKGQLAVSPLVRNSFLKEKKTVSNQSPENSTGLPLDHGNSAQVAPPSSARGFVE